MEHLGCAVGESQYNEAVVLLLPHLQCVQLEGFASEEIQSHTGLRALSHMGFEAANLRTGH